MARRSSIPRTVKEMQYVCGPNLTHRVCMMCVLDIGPIDWIWQNTLKTKAVKGAQVKETADPELTRPSRLRGTQQGESQLMPPGCFGEAIAQLAILHDAEAEYRATRPIALRWD